MCADSVTATPIPTQASARASAQDAPSPFLIQARLLSDAASELAFELLMDQSACAMHEELSLDQVAAMGRRVGHLGRIVLAGAVRACSRCSEPLYSAEDRLSGFCEPCRENRRALVAIAAAGGAQ